MTSEIRRCGFCNTPAEMTVDTEAERKYHCQNCDAVETISKSKNGWWYFGWKRPDGAKLRAPTSEEMRQNKWGWQPDNN